MLINLCRNAMQAMPAGGVLELQTYKRGDAVFLEIIDNGQGMTAETKSRMFETFFQPHPMAVALACRPCERLSKPTPERFRAKVKSAVGLVLPSRSPPLAHRNGMLQSLKNSTVL